MHECTWHACTPCASAAPPCPFDGLADAPSEVQAKAHELSHAALLQTAQDLAAVAGRTSINED